jgi:hypothetical protein
MQIYWREILARSHFAAVTAILRSRHWIGAIISAAESENCLAFAAAFRGLIESAADASTALTRVPRTLARDHPWIMRALSGGLAKKAFLAPELENMLIHFAYARHLTKAQLASAPRSHKALKVREYIGDLEKGQVREVVDCYQELCDMTHPGASSVWIWAKPVNELQFDLAEGQDSSVISNFVDRYQKTFRRAVDSWV